MTGSRFAMFFVIVLSIWAAMHLYVFWRAAGIPWVAAHLSSRKMLVWAAVGLWASYPLARYLESLWPGSPVWVLEFAAATWIGILFLLFVSLLAADVVTLGGFVFPRLAPHIRGWAVVGAGVLSVIALVQALRAPVVLEHEVRLAGLRAEHDGLRLAVISDLHLGPLIGERWLARRVEQVNELKPDLVLAVGDVVDGSATRLEPILRRWKELQAPLGTWAVTGNHEFYAGLDQSVRLLEGAGCRVLRDTAVEVAPGLVLAGVDDLTARLQYGGDTGALRKALADRPPGATILLSHSPLQAEEAAAAGVGLMLSGHTHNGQIWPFKYLVRLRYPLLGGRYEVQGMSVIVCRGTGTWGPRLRLWRPSELLLVRLRA